MQKGAITEYTVGCCSAPMGIKLAVVSDLHSRAGTEIQWIIQALESKRPDYILMPGDIFEKLDGSLKENKQQGFELLRRASPIAPVLYSIGNHENGGVQSWNKMKWKKDSSHKMVYDQAELDEIFESGAAILDNGYVIDEGIAFGGLTSGFINARREPELGWLDEFCELDVPKILLCHHPEYYPKYLKNRNIDLIVSGHAHGGQWRIFGRGIFSPGQGLFPKYAAGVHDSRLVVSCGLKEGKPIPRFFNPPEIVFVNI